MGIGLPDLSAHLFEAVVRVLTKCARGQHPLPTDVQLLKARALPNESDMEPAELAGATVWRVSNNETSLGPQK